MNMAPAVEMQLGVGGRFFGLTAPQMWTARFWSTVNIKDAAIVAMDTRFAIVSILRLYDSLYVGSMCF